MILRQQSHGVEHTEPDWASTFHAIGDTHIGALLAGRLDAVTADLPNLPNPLIHVQVGDSTNDAIPEQDAEALAWLNALPVDWVSACGNHDIHLDSRTVADWEAAYGMQKNQTVDLGPFLLVIAGPDTAPSSAIVLSLDTVDWMEAEFAAATKPAVAVVHAPINDTVQGWRPSDSQFGINDPAYVRPMLARSPSCVAWVAGHTHSNVMDRDFTKRELVVDGATSRYVASVNVSAIHYVGFATASAGHPIRTGYVTVDPSGDWVELRMRDHVSQSWVGSYAGMQPRIHV